MEELILAKNQIKAEIERVKIERSSYAKTLDKITTFDKEMRKCLDYKIEGLERAVKLIEMRLESKGE